MVFFTGIHLHITKVHIYLVCVCVRLYYIKGIKFTYRCYRINHKKMHWLLLLVMSNHQHHSQIEKYEIYTRSFNNAASRFTFWIAYLVRHIRTHSSESFILRPDWNFLAKCFKLCLIFGKRKFKGFFSLHFDQLRICVLFLVAQKLVLSKDLV